MTAVEEQALEDPPRMLVPWRKWVEDQLALAAERQDTANKLYAEQQKRQHLVTRFWVLLVTAPAWGDFMSSVVKSISPVQGTVGGIVATVAGGGLVAVSRLLRGGLN